MLEVMDWHGCYRSTWRHIMRPAAIHTHPAKFARGLVQRIYRHAAERGYVRPGDCVLDPFAGVAGGAYDALRGGLTWLGVELEPDMVMLGRANIDHWNALNAENPAGRWGTATLLEGNSRQLQSLLVSARPSLVVSSPPWGRTLARDSADPEARRAWARANGISDAARVSPIDLGRTGAADGRYGRTEGQLGNNRDEAFWQASADILAQIYSALRRGGVAIWVVKDYVRGGQRVSFAEQWHAAGLSAGFTELERARAWLVRDRANAVGLLDTEYTAVGQAVHVGGGGRLKTPTAKRASFTRRMAEAAGAPPIDYEDVLIWRKM